MAHLFVEFQITVKAFSTSKFDLLNFPTEYTPSLDAVGVLDNLCSSVFFFIEIGEGFFVCLFVCLFVWHYVMYLAITYISKTTFRVFLF